MLIVKYFFSNYQTPSDEISGSDPKSNVKSHGNKSEAKFPAIDKTSVKQKQKSSSIMKKNEKSGSGSKKDMQGMYGKIFREINCSAQDWN